MALGLQPTLGQTDSKKNINRYGLHEGLELVGRVDGKGYETFAVVDENDRLLFAIPLRNCMFDVRLPQRTAALPRERHRPRGICRPQRQRDVLQHRHRHTLYG